MSNSFVKVEVDVVSEEKLLKSLAKAGIRMPVQCNEGICGTCWCKSDPKQFDEVHDQLGNLDSDINVLPCSVKAKSGVSKVIVELPAHLVPAHKARLDDSLNKITI